MKKKECNGCFFLASCKTDSVCMSREGESISEVIDCKSKVNIKSIKRVSLKKTHGKYDPYGLDRYQVYLDDIELAYILSAKDIKCVVLVMDDNLNVEQSFFLTDEMNMKKGDCGRIVMFNPDKCYIGYLEK